MPIFSHGSVWTIQHSNKKKESPKKPLVGIVTHDYVSSCLGIYIFHACAGRRRRQPQFFRVFVGASRPWTISQRWPWPSRTAAAPNAAVISVRLGEAKCRRGRKNDVMADHIPPDLTGSQVPWSPLICTHVSCLAADRLDIARRAY